MAPSALTMDLDDFDATELLMPLEAPILKVSRPVAACSRCRNAKIKCDGKLPACSSCEKNGRAAECTSTNDQFARGKERSYVSTLETRIDRLQAKLEEARARKPSVISIAEDEPMTAVQSRRTSEQIPADAQTPTPPTSGSTPNANTSPSSNGPPTATSKAMRRQEAATIDDLVSDFGILSVNATARDFYGFTSAMSYSRLILSACSKDDLPVGMAAPLPARYAATTLIQHYLTNVYALLPVFDEASFYASVDNVYARNCRMADGRDHFMVRIVLAIASASMSAQRGDQHYMSSIGHVCAALEHTEEVLHPGSIASIQALVLLTEYAMLDPHHFDSWSLIGAASRAMVDLGMHQDPPKGTAMLKGKLDLRRRVFYCVYNLDRSTALVQTRAFSFSDDSAKVKIPFAKGPSPPTSAISAPTSPAPPTTQQLWRQTSEYALELINLRKLQSAWYTDLFQSGRAAWDEPYPYLWDTCDALRRWFDGLPATTPPHMRAFFELELLYSYVYVLSPSPRVPAVGPYAQKLIFEYCIRYAELMLRLLRDPAYTAPMTFYDAMRVYMTGRQFLDVLQHHTDALLTGHRPPLPDVKPTTAPPPTMPNVAIPPHESLPRFNTARSIACIKQITECLSQFGIRWGYMSWNQRYQTETASMLEQLTQRLRDLDELAAIARRQSMWPHHNSASSIGSNDGSVSMAAQPMMTGASPPGVLYPAGHNPAVGVLSTPPYQPQQSLGAYSLNGTGFMTSPPQAHQASPPPPAGLYSYNSGLSQPQHGQPGQQHPMTGSMHSHPTHQFANWGGISAPPPAGGPDTLDEENAVPPMGVL